MPVEPVIAGAVVVVAQGGPVSTDQTATFLLGTNLTRANLASADLPGTDVDRRDLQPIVGAE
jgi:hypothetical protein